MFLLENPSGFTYSRPGRGLGELAVVEVVVEALGGHEILAIALSTVRFAFDGAKRRPGS